VYQPKPALTTLNKQSVVLPASVDVKVFIGEGGRVASAEIVEFGDPPNFTLANAALAASRNWTFEPARLGELPVSSEMILHFRFGL
jgi:outer membrane biosynthesis protein TonB